MTGSLLSLMVFTWKEGTPPEAVARVTAALEHLRETSSGVQRFEFGPSAALSPISQDYGVAIVFDDADAWRGYLASEAHDAFRAESSGIAASTSIVQLTV